MAEDNQFDAECLAAPGRPQVPHLSREPGRRPAQPLDLQRRPGRREAEQLYKGKPIKGPGQEEYAIDEMAPGEYYFQDDKVPDMNGTILIEKPKKK